MKIDQPHFIDVGDGPQCRSIAYRRRQGQGPGLIWLGGFKSDMQGTKAEAIDHYAVENGRSFLRFDYSGHGESGGEFVDGTISRWLEEAKAVLRDLSKGPQILVGSSLGGWIALLLALAAKVSGENLPQISGLVLIAPAADFTERLMWADFDEQTKKLILQEGKLVRPTSYDDDPYIFTKELFEDGRKNLIMNGSIEIGCPVHILQGGEDNDVPKAHALEVAQCLAGTDVTFTLIKDGDHRLSRDEDIARLLSIIEEMSQ